jgi:hypothetical protein
MGMAASSLLNKAFTTVSTLGGDESAHTVTYTKQKKTAVAQEV